MKLFLNQKKNKTEICKDDAGRHGGQTSSPPKTRRRLLPPLPPSSVPQSSVRHEPVLSLPNPKASCLTGPWSISACLHDGLWASASQKPSQRPRGAWTPPTQRTVMVGKANWGQQNCETCWFCYFTLPEEGCKASACTSVGGAYVCEIVFRFRNKPLNGRVNELHQHAGALIHPSSC